ncbi:MAG: 50S ribosomal protein L4, partial [Conexivisphaerales archaeon]
MEASVLDKDGNEVSKVQIPDILTKTDINEKVIKKAFMADLSNTFQLHYPNTLAGKKKSVFWTKRRRRWRSAYRGDISRTPAKTTWHSGNSWMRIGAFVPQAVGGREAHPPTPTMNQTKKINKKEKKRAIIMALAASINKDFVSKYHKVENVNLPIVFDDDIVNITKAKDLRNLFEKIGLKEEMEKIMKVKISSTKGKYRGRKYKKRSPLILISFDASYGLRKTAENLNIKVIKAGR